MIQHRYLVATGLALLAATSAGPANAADESPTRPGFGQRGSFLLSVENAFGILNQTYSEGNTDVSVNGTGFFASGLGLGFSGTRLGLHGLASSGLTYGGVVGFAALGETGSGHTHVTALMLGPRIGYAGSMPKTAVVGYWARIGPTFGWFDTGGGSSSSSTFITDLSIEAFLVWTPVEHFGVLGGPTFDIPLYGSTSSSGNNTSSQDIKWQTFGMSLGLVFDM
jgi:hypothetical protein